MSASELETGSYPKQKLVNWQEKKPEADIQRLLVCRMNGQRA